MVYSNLITYIIIYRFESMHPHNVGLMETAFQVCMLTIEDLYTPHLHVYLSMHVTRIHVIVCTLLLFHEFVGLKSFVILRGNHANFAQ